MAHTDTVRLFGADEIRRTVGIGDVRDAVAKALATFSAGGSLSPPISFIALENGGEVHLKSGYARGAEYFVTKIASMVPSNRDRDLPTSNGLILLCSAETGFPVALLHDRKYLTDIRTAAVGAIAAELLAPGSVQTVGILGSGGQAVLQAQAVALVRSFSSIMIWGRDAGRTAAAAREIGRRIPGKAIALATSAEQVVRAADILVTATAAREPIVRGEWLRPGVHVTALGADDPRKAELDAECFRRAAFVACDSRSLVLKFGEIARGVTDGRLSAEIIDAELGELLNGSAQFRRHAGDITICKQVGIGIEDLFVAQAFYQRAVI